MKCLFIIDQFDITFGCLHLYCTVISTQYSLFYGGILGPDEIWLWYICLLLIFTDNYLVFLMMKPAFDCKNASRPRLIGDFNLHRNCCRKMGKLLVFFSSFLLPFLFLFLLSLLFSIRKVETMLTFYAEHVLWALIYELYPFYYSHSHALYCGQLFCLIFQTQWIIGKSSMEFSWSKKISGQIAQNLATSFAYPWDGT